MTLPRHVNAFRNISGKSTSEGLKYFFDNMCLPGYFRYKLVKRIYTFIMQETTTDMDIKNTGNWIVLQ